MTVKPRAGRSVLDAFRQSGSLKCLFPRVFPGKPQPLQAVLVNTAGGITGGDAFRVEAAAAPGTQLTLTTQAAERAYAAQPGEVGHLATQLKVGAEARLNWLPQETILYDHCAFDRRLCVDLDDGAEFLLVEPLVFGRLAMGETLTDATFGDRIDIRRNGRPLFLDATRLAGDIDAQLARPAIGGGARAMALAVFVGPRADAHLGAIHGLLPTTGGASLIGRDVLVIRLVAADGYGLRQSLLPILTRLTDDTLPRCWTI